MLGLMVCKVRKTDFRHQRFFGTNVLVNVRHDSPKKRFNKQMRFGHLYRIKKQIDKREDFSMLAVNRIDAKQILIFPFNIMHK